MTNSWRKLLLASVLCHVVAFLIVLVLAVTSFSLKSVHPTFQVRWIMAQTWADYLSLAPVAQAWAVVITFSLVIPSQSGGTAGSGFERFGSSIIVLLVLTLGFSLAYGVGHPRAVRNRGSLEFSSAVAETLLATAHEAYDGQDYERARTYLQQHMAIVGEEDETLDFMTNIRRAADQDAARLSHEEAGEVADRDRPAGARVLTERAAAALENEDYSNAHYLATLARSLDRDNAEAARIAAEALQRLSQSLPSEEENEQAELFREIQAAKESLDRGDIIDAFYRFKDLHERHPINTDITRYFAEVSVAVRELTIFEDELHDVLTMPGVEDFMFVNSADEESVELISIGKLVRLAAGTYVHQIEVMRFSRDGILQYHLMSDFGKYSEGSIILTVRDPESRQGIRLPVVRAGSLDPETENLVWISPSADELWLIGIASADPAGASIPDLIRTAGAVPDYGLVPEPIQAELLYRLSIPFVCLILNILALGFAWRYRSRYLTRPPVLALLAVPLAPLALIPVYVLFRYAHRLLLSTLLLWTGLVPSVVALLCAEAVLLAVSLTYLALSSRE